MSAKRGPRSSEIRVSGLLRMLPWLMKHERVSVASMAAQFDMSESDLIEDIEMASMCGVPPYTPFELTDIYIDEGYIFVGANKRFERNYLASIGAKNSRVLLRSCVKFWAKES